MRGSPRFASGQFGGLSRAPGTRVNPASSVSLWELGSALPPGIVHQETLVLSLKVWFDR